MRSGTRLLLVRRRSGVLLRDWWEVPTCRTGDAELDRAPGPLFAPRDPAADSLAGALRARLGLSAGGMRRAARVRHGILHHRLDVEVLVGRAEPGRRVANRAGPARARTARMHAPGVAQARPARTPLANLDLADLETRWVAPRECRRLPLSTLSRKALRGAAALDSRWSEYLDGEPAEEPRRERRRDPSREHL